MAVRMSALRTGRCFTPQKHYFYASGTHFCYEVTSVKWSRLYSSPLTCDLRSLALRPCSDVHTAFEASFLFTYVKSLYTLLRLRTRDQVLRYITYTFRSVLHQLTTPSGTFLKAGEFCYEYATTVQACKTKQQTPWPLVRKRIIPTERPPLVDEIQCQLLWIEGCHVVSAADPPRSLISVF
jgi:hypothetical protein